MSIERRFDIPLIASMALKEKQIQQNYRPIIAVHKWFARRPGTLFRGLMLAEFGSKRLDEEYFASHDFADKRIADPFMGGGTPLIEANRLGFDVSGFDINPMAAWIVREEIAHLDVASYRKAAAKLVQSLEDEIGEFYRTDCPHYGQRDVPVKYFLWVKTIPCEECDHDVNLFPGYLLADDTRHPKNVVVCSCCGELNEVANLNELGRCKDCSQPLTVEARAKRGRCACPSCGHINRYPRPEAGPLGHRLFAIEYYNPERKKDHVGRFFKKPDKKDLARLARAEKKWRTAKPRFVPTEAIPAGDETDRLHKWGYAKYADLFNARQLHGLELSCRRVAAVKDVRTRQALATNLSDLLRYQNMLCRYDTMALKSLDVFSVHGFPVGLVQCESNLLGISNGSGTSVGSGGWSNIIEKYAKAKTYCDAPFEIQHLGKKKVQVHIPGEWIGETRKGSRSRKVSIRCTSSTNVDLPDGSLDAVFTDPPYFSNVQYAELMDFCFAWLRKLVPEAEGFDQASTRAKDELTVNATEGRDLEHYTEGLAAVYSRMARALKQGAPFAFTYHHNKLDAYKPIGVAILDAGLRCSASIPCPAEMGGSIHIHNTTSSIIDTVFVCRSNGHSDRQTLFSTTTQLARIVSDDLGKLRLAGVKPSVGDMRCITFGHLTRMAIWNLRETWDQNTTTTQKLAAFDRAFDQLPRTEDVVELLTSTHEAKKLAVEHGLPLFVKREKRDVVAF